MSAGSEAGQAEFVGPGNPLDPALRSQAEGRLGRDLTHVRVHTDPGSAEIARGLGALAYTMGHHIVFAGGRYAPHTPGGDRLIWHELAHVVQQGGSGGSAPGEAHERAADVAAEGVLSGDAPVHVGPAAAPGLQRQAAVPSGAAPAPEDPAVVTEIDAELAQVQPIVSRLVASVRTQPREVALAEVRGLAARLEQDERVVAGLSTGPGSSPRIEAGLTRIRALRADLAPAVVAAQRWHDENPAGESLGMTNERWGTAAAGYGERNWEQGNYARGAAGYVGAFGVAFLDAGEQVFSFGFHEAATAVSTAYARGDISWNEGERILRSAAWRALLAAAVTRGAGAAGGRLGGLAARGLGLAPEALATGAARGIAAGGLSASAALGTQALTTQALQDGFRSPAARAIWARGMPTGRDWAISVPLAIVLGGLGGIRAVQAGNARLVGTVVDTPGGRMRVVTVTARGTVVLEPEAGLRTPPPPPPPVEIVLVYDPATGSWRAPSAGGGGPLATTRASAPATPPRAPVRAPTPAVQEPVRGPGALVSGPTADAVPDPAAARPPALPPSPPVPQLPARGATTPAPSGPSATTPVAPAAPRPPTPAMILAARRVAETQAALATASGDAGQARVALASARAQLLTAEQLAAEPGAGQAGRDLVAEAELSVRTAERSLRRLEQSETAARREAAAVAGGSSRIAQLESEIAQVTADIQAELHPSRGPQRGFTLEEYRAGRRPGIPPRWTEPGGQRYAGLTSRLARLQAQLNAEIVGLSETLAERVAAATPGAEARPLALANAAALDPPLRPVNGVPVDVTTGRPMTTSTWAVDHIKSRSLIARDPRFARLSPRQQVDLLLGVPENYFPLTVEANSSKGALTMEQWIQARAAAGRPFSPQVADALRKMYARAEAALEARFEQFSADGPGN